jgi:energy-coupling factor transporter ATP-binding protein EcfA2
MPLNKLSIRGFRGIRELDVSFGGKNVAVVGSNGSGKSSIADSLDFLLTGQIKRLTGEGAGSLSFAKHAPNLKMDPASSHVLAEFTTGTGASVVLRRNASDPDTLVTQGVVPAEVQRILDLAAAGNQHMLTRREILKFIFTEPAKRGEQVAALLRLTQLDSLRKEIQGAAKMAADASREASAISQTRQSSVLRSFDPPALRLEDVGDRINGHRTLLGAKPVSVAEPSTFRINIAAPATAASNPLQSQRCRDLIGSLAPWFQRDAEQAAREIASYTDHIRGVQKDAAQLKSLRSIELLRLGRVLAVDDECPLCLREMDKSAIRALIESRTAEAREAEGRLRDLRNTNSDLRTKLITVSTTIQSLGEQVRPVDAEAGEAFVEFGKSLAKDVAAIVLDPVVDASGALEVEEVGHRIAPGAIGQLVTDLEAKVERLPKLGGIQRAWDELSAAETAVKEWAAAVASAGLADRVAKELAAADRAFLESRDAVLQQTYDLIAARFSKLYATVHGEDEGSFAASLNPTKAGLKLEVDFYGLGEFPPCAVHSEGHQDSMGLCLFLTLTEYLAGGPVPMLILDDVLSSVDRDHRRAVGSLLKTEFAGCQFLITTHDRVWWRQLRTLGLVSGRAALELKGWSLDTGPIAILDAGRLLAESYEALKAGNVPGAAHALRRGAEAYLPDICDALGARVRFRADGAWEAGDFLSSAIGRYGEILGLARAAANSWNNTSTDWTTIDVRRKSVVESFNLETWAVNANVHFNEWADFTVADFTPVLAAYDQLFGLFLCDICGSTLHLIEENNTPVGFRCDCAITNWNLKSKPKA